MQKDAKTNDRIKGGARVLDCTIQGGLHSLRNKTDVNLKQKIKEGLSIRILIPKNATSPEMEEANKDLEDWFCTLDEKQMQQVTIRKYDGIPQELYFRLDERVFVGPYFANLATSKNITYEFDLHSDGGKIYSNNFEDLWHRSHRGQIA
jgi:hypothetical protein